MSRDPNGVYTLPPSYFVQTGDTILPVQHNPVFESVAEALTNSLARDGRTVMTGDLQMGGNKITGLADGALPSDGVNKGQIEVVEQRLDDEKLNKDGSNLDAADAWAMQPIGVPIPIFTHLAGVPEPPTDSPYFRYIKLTASDAYNAGILTGENVTGSAPLVQATAIISDAESPLNGQTVRLINTERRVLRAGAVGTVEDDQMQKITGRSNRGFGSSDAPINDEGALSTVRGTNRGRQNVVGTDDITILFDSANSPGARAGDETRPKNIGVDYYMRIR